jgi:transcriptional regulator with GAF, ATPase, and Fis domain
VAATNRNLKAAVAARQYREDLYFRLSVFPISIPPLRERPADIPILARYFVDRFCRDLNKPSLVLSPQALEALMAYPWRGNVRELQNCIERVVILTEGETIHPRHLSLVAPAERDTPGLASDVDPWDAIDLSGPLAEVSRRVLQQVERRKISQALREASGNLGGAAEILQVSYKAMLAKVRDLGLENQALRPTA